MIAFSKLSTSSWVKFALIPILSAVLIWQLWPAGQTPQTPLASAVGDALPQSAQPAATARKMNVDDQRTWPEADLSRLLKHDPFEPPPALSRADAAATAEKSAAKAAAAKATQSATQHATTVLRWESKRVSVVLISPQGASAVVDSKVCRVNDWLEPGVRVAEIRPEGVVLSVEPSGK